MNQTVDQPPVFVRVFTGHQFAHRIIKVNPFFGVMVCAGVRNQVNAG
jgi:hypothetical protein